MTGSQPASGRIVLRDDGLGGRELAIAGGRQDGGVVVAPVSPVEALALAGELLSWASNLVSVPASAGPSVHGLAQSEAALLALPRRGWRFLARLRRGWR